MKYQTPFKLLSIVVFGTQILQAAPVMRPGLWENTVIIKTQSGQMEQAMSEMNKQMASMPPEQRKMMEKMMASQGVSKTPQGNTIKMCITKEEAQEGYVPTSDGQCSQEIIRRSGNTMQVKFSCAGNPPSSGEGEYTFSSNNAYTGKMTVRTTTQGHAEVIQMKQSGKWLSDNCGTIKPIKH